MVLDRFVHKTELQTLLFSISEDPNLSSPEKKKFASLEEDKNSVDNPYVAGFG